MAPGVESERKERRGLIAGVTITAIGVVTSVASALGASIGHSDLYSWGNLQLLAGVALVFTGVAQVAAIRMTASRRRLREYNIRRRRRR